MNFMRSVLHTLFLFMLTTTSYAQISGKVFRDLNADGMQQAAEPSIAGAVINAYDANNTLLNTTTTAANGTYSIPYTVPVRVEFELPITSTCFMQVKDYCGAYPNGDNVRFFNAGATNVDFAVQNPEDFILPGPPNVYVSRFNKGNPLLVGSAADTTRAIYGFPNTTTGNVATAPIPNSIRTGATGSVFGMAYSKHAKCIFSAAFLKRYSGLGPLGTGGIYKLVPSGNTFTCTNFYDMDANGHRTRAASGATPFGLNSSFSINAASTQISYLGPTDPLTGEPEGLGVVGANDATGRKLIGTLTYTIDSSVFDQICKVGLGDIDISDDGRFLFVTNLYSRLIYRLELDNVMNPNGVIAVDSFAIPAIPVNNGVLRPFGLCIRKGVLYIGAVSTAENGGVNILNGLTDMYAYVFTLTDPNGISPVMNPSPFFTMPLNYHKGTAVGTIGSGTDLWHPWTDLTSVLIGNGEKAYPSPVLSDIGFDDREDLILDFMDRAGHQFGYGGSFQKLSGTSTVAVDIGGDIITAGADCVSGVYTLENNGSYTSSGTNYSSAGVGNNQGIGGGEFYVGDTGNAAESEGSQGSLAMLPGQNAFMFTMMDVQGLINAGTCILSCNTGAKSSTLIMATGTQFGKANSMGDIEVSGDVPSIQIGNRVWKDDNNNGIQDPEEAGIENVTLELFADFNNDNNPDGPVLGSSTTDAAGRYYFDVTNVADGDPVTAGAQPGPLAYRTYLIQIAASDWTGGAGVNELAAFTLTQFQTPGTGTPEVRDNDAKLQNNIPTVVATTEFNAKNLFNFDIGFIPCEDVPLQDVYLSCANPIMMIGPIPQDGYTYSWSPAIGLNATNVAQPFASPSTTTTYTLTTNKYCFETMTVNVDNLPPPVDPGPEQHIDCKNKSVVLGSPAIPGYSYFWSPSKNISNNQIAQPTVNPESTTTYTVVVTGANGCNATATTTVFVENCCTRVALPNSFTPNGDKLNDTFGVIEIEELHGFSLYVYNRWGEQVFYSTKKEDRWDGKYKGVACDPGTYFYLLIYDCTGVSKQLQGDLTLVW